MTAISVLVIEDDAMIGMLLAEMLGDMGYDVCAITATEEDAVAAAARHNPGLMIVDAHLQEGSGQSAIERILRTGPIPVVFISGVPVYPAKPEAHVLLKPFFEEDLVRAINHVVGRRDEPALQSPPPPQAVIGH
jgi:CheY-like chemotaxis protein